MVMQITLDRLREFNNETPRSIVNKAEKRSRYRSTFLSYSSKDDELLPAVISILENHGADVYIDKADPNLPEKTSKETAAILRNSVSECSRFVLFVTPNSKDSKWIPWELGLADGEKDTSNVALFPAVESILETTWSEQEYLGLYRRIVWGDLKGQEKSQWLVYDHIKNTAVLLKDWLR